MRVVAIVLTVIGVVGLAAAWTVNISCGLGDDGTSGLVSLVGATGGTAALFGGLHLFGRYR